MADSSFADKEALPVPSGSDSCDSGRGSDNDTDAPPTQYSITSSVVVASLDDPRAADRTGTPERGRRSPRHHGSSRGQSPAVYDRGDSANALIREEYDAGGGFTEDKAVLALESGNVAHVKAMLASGWKVNWEIGKRKETSLMHAIRSKNEDVIKLLCDHGAKVDLPDEDGWTALMFAAAIGCLPVVKALIAAGANVNRKNNLHERPLIFAATNNHEKVFSYLLDCGAEYNFRTYVGTSPVSILCEHGHFECLQTLYRKHPDLDFKVYDGAGLDPLMLAAKNGHMPVVKWLVLEGHCSPLEKTKNGTDASTLAYANTYYDIHHFIEQYLKEHHMESVDLTEVVPNKPPVLAPEGFMSQVKNFVRDCLE
ncbi:Ankyrin repeat and KH domain-containing protein mask [Diplonema papillatum]|nr:Ankyrin repeat and KH domain-containing protein mask [Diplonema papillatum]|eukprot:gene5992-9199_t